MLNALSQLSGLFAGEGADTPVRAARPSVYALPQELQETQRPCQTHTHTHRYVKHTRIHAGKLYTRAFTQVCEKHTYTGTILA
ncbi:hypothetical protein DPMN_175932 [Dreissena polymorpha]|uniref:Uncharacterized protein n=1 Tax=Dreissena polymorpha TaxID=45954 RepID=A0A9D4E8P2_DREPO|nr:hypothetical protein DPMN_175932 [Dreissena polymorpha]